MSKPHENYALESVPLGRGGQAEVFRARDKRTGAIVALKRILGDLKRNETALARMKREIEVQTALQHRNVMPILDRSTTTVWYTMPLAARVMGNLITPINDQELLSIVENCARGLAVAHQAGFIHRDLTPNNVLELSDAAGTRWVVSDWGLVRRHGQTTNVNTVPGTLFGTEAFAAPEMWTDAHSVDGRADIYSLGRIVAWSLTGQLPAPNIEMIPKGIWAEFVRMTTLLDVSQRPRNMQQVLEYVEKLKLSLSASEAIRSTLAVEIKLLPGLDHTDSAVLKAACEVSLSTQSTWLDVNQVRLAVLGPELPLQEFFDSIDILAEAGYVSGQKVLDGTINPLQITTRGFEQYAIAYLPKFSELLEAALVSGSTYSAKTNLELAAKLQQPRVLIDYALEIQTSRGLIQTTRVIGGTIYIGELTARGRRAARGH